MQTHPSWIGQLKKRMAVPTWKSIFSFRLAGVAAVAAAIAFFAFSFILKLPHTSTNCSAEVQFSLKLNDTKIQTVAIAGDFNSWNQRDNLLEDPDQDGIWTATLKLKPGRYEYMFVLDGKNWIPDPNALRYVKDGFGNKNAVLEINNCNFS